MLHAGQDIILYGSGRRCTRILPLLTRAGISIKAVIDSGQAKQGTRIEDLQVQAPSVLREYSNTVLCITVADPVEQDRKSVV